MRPHFYMIAGLPGSGKSTLSRKILNTCEREGRKAVSVSSDAMRRSLFGDVGFQGDNARVFGEMARIGISALRDGRDVVYDATNVNARKRKAFVDSIGGIDCEKTCCICATPLDVCLERNRKRNRHVPERAIVNMYKMWSTPFYNEGWDRIELIYADGAAGSLGTPESFAESLAGYEQDNPHHMETLGEHLISTRRILTEEYGADENSNVALAALLHDCGKPFTKVFTDRKGNPTGVAHYYMHEGAGAYDSLFFKYDNKSRRDILEISFLIGRHMDPFNWKSEESRHKAANRFGEEMLGYLEMIHYADVNASITDTGEDL